MTKEFNLQDLRNRYAFEEKLGAGIRYMDPETRVLYDTLPFQAIKLAKQNKLLSEEMRKLYVGLTGQNKSFSLSVPIKIKSK